jgi:hypothetical protein
MAYKIDPVGYAYAVDNEIRNLSGKRRSSFSRPWQKIIDQWVIMNWEDGHTPKEAAQEILDNYEALVGNLTNL